MADQLRYPVTDEERDVLLADARATRAAQAGADPLRDLLADEDRAVELLTAVVKRQGGALTAYRIDRIARAVLAALREVAGP